jgi:hypothetical protein
MLRLQNGMDVRSHPICLSIGTDDGCLSNKSIGKSMQSWNNGAGTRWKGWPFGITYASIEENESAKGVMPGTILSIDTVNGFTIATNDAKAIKAESGLL